MKKVIEVENATVHNLKGVSASFPKNATTCLTGRSGSGKSSFAIDIVLRACVDPNFSRGSSENIVRGTIPAIALRQRLQSDRGAETADKRLNLHDIPKNLPLGDILVKYLSRTQINVSSPVSHLSLGQQQWVRLLNLVREARPGMLILLDEPTAGMCAEDTMLVVNLCRDLVQRRCTVLIIEHSPLVILHSDYVIEFGPGGGNAGGQITFAGTQKEFLKSSVYTLSAIRLLSAPAAPVKCPRPGISIRNIEDYGLAGLQLKFPQRAWTCITGPIGSGKSGAIDVLFRATDKSASAWANRTRAGTVQGREKIRRPHIVDQQPIGINPHSIPLTYIDAMSALRERFVEAANGKSYGVEHFSFNSPAGHCPKCEGYGNHEVPVAGESYISSCAACKGLRYKPNILSVKYQGKSIGEVLQMTVKDAAQLLHNDCSISKKLNFLEQVGLGYLVLGQPSGTLSGGEAQRVKIAKQLAKRLGDRTLYLLDTPSRGLSLLDADLIAKVFHSLARHNAVVIADNHPSFVTACDWLIVLDRSSGGKAKALYCGPTQSAPRKLIRHITGLDY